MLFHTWVFFVFFLIVYPVYLLVRKNNRLMNIWLMIASYTFYGWWNPVYLLLLFGTSAIDYWMVVMMEKSDRHRKLWLVISLVSNFGFLGYFKYSIFLTQMVNAAFPALGMSFALPDPVWYPNSVISLFSGGSHFFEKVVLPIGISFHTFQSMSYTIDAYYGHIKTERSFIRFLTFVSFFPQLVAGPIERASNLLPQLQGTPPITRRDISDGLSLFLVGFFKKVALADYLALYVEKVYDAPVLFNAPALCLATVAFGWQIYFDFSGYTDMARGVAQLMGFRLMLNFNNPYVATSLGDFWNRWHISLSTWFKDYVYFPLGGSRGGKFMTYRNMFLTMVISGVWHGAAWVFIIWGGLHALGRCLTRELEQTQTYQERVPKFVKQMLVFVFVSFTWIFFRATVKDQPLNISKATTIISRIFTTSWTTYRMPWSSETAGSGVSQEMPLLMVGLILAVWVYQFCYSSEGWGRRLVELKAVRVGLVLLMVAYLLIVAQPSTEKFIYFDF
jgi:D-alanyl-lipoteichoic acid acyltransferase DltB (MBOAT superfamily)